MSNERLSVYFLALRRCEVPAELHIYAEGGHGYGPARHTRTSRHDVAPQRGNVAPHASCPVRLHWVRLPGKSKLASKSSGGATSTCRSTFRAPL